MRAITNQRSNCVRVVTPSRPVSTSRAGLGTTSLLATQVSKRGLYRTVHCERPPAGPPPALIGRASPPHPVAGQRTLAFATEYNNLERPDAASSTPFTGAVDSSRAFAGAGLLDHAANNDDANNHDVLALAPWSPGP